MYIIFALKTKYPQKHTLNNSIRHKPPSNLATTKNQQSYVYFNPAFI